MKSRILFGPIARFAPIVSLIFALPAFAANDTWNQTAAGTFSWDDPVNWVSGTQFPNVVGDVANVNVNITGNQTINLNQAITVGTLNLGDSATGFFTTTVNAGVGGSFTFDVASGNALLARTATVNPGVNDIINASITLNDPLSVSLPWLANGNGIQITGTISGTGGLTAINAALPTSVVNSSQILDITNTNNSFTGDFAVANGAVVYRGDVIPSTNGALGNSANAVRVSSSATLAGTVGTGLQNTTTNQLRLQASDDTTNYVFSRDLDFSGANDTAARVGRSRFGISGDGAGGLNTNTLTVSGAVTLPSTNRGVEFLAARQAQTIRFTGAINTASGGTGTIFWGPGAPGGVNSDGRTNGTYRFSDLARTYTNTQNLTNGTVIIEASVGATNAASPIGTQTFNLADGNGGNLFSANTEGANRRIFLEAAETSFNRTLSPGQGTGTDLSSLSSANQARYGNSGFQRAMNGYEFGGLNTTGKITYLQNIAAQNVSVPATGTAAGAGGTNPVTTVHNFALTAANGGTVEFTGVISGNTRPVLGSTSTPGAAVSANNARVTINQFRNHPNLDSNLDGLPDANADALVGAPTNGTVILGGANTYGGTTEVLGGALLVNGSIAGDTVTVAPGAALGGTGTINPGLAGSTVQINGILAPGASAGELTINKNLSFNSGSTFSLELDGLASGVLGGYDQLTIGPGATISLNSAANVALTLNFAPAINDSFTVIDNLGAGAIGGTFANLANFGSISADFGGQTYTFQANYSGGDGNDLTLTVVPEPSAILALLSGMSLLAIRRQRSS